MTISTTTIKNSYSGNDSTDAFSYTFKITADSEMQVIIRSSTGSETVKSLTTHYTVSGAGNASGGTVTFTTGNIPATGETVILRRNTAQTQGMDLIENDPLPANTLETAVDKNLAIAQELQEQLDRSFKVSRTNTITSPEFTTSATDRASKTLGFDSDGNLTTVSDFLPAGGDSAQFTYSTTTTDSDPGSGKIRFNNTTLASATAAYIDDLEANGTDVSAWLLSFDDVTGNATNRGRIRVSKSNTLDTWHVWKITGASTDASGYVKLSLTYIDGAGSLANDDKVFLSFSASGEDGAIPGYYYKFDTGTSDADPGSGELSFNNGTYASVTTIFIDDADANGVTTQADTESWGTSTSTIKGFIHIVDINDSTTYARFKVTAAVVDASGYNKITVVHLASNNTFSAADELSVHFTRTANDGSVPGYLYTFDSGTSDTDPGSGEISFNNGTYASVTAIYIDDDDKNGVTTQTDTITWDDSTSTIKGYLHIVDTNDPTTYARFSITGSSTDASGYNKLAVTHLASNNTFSAADTLSVHFTRQGDKGDTGSTGSTGSQGNPGVAGLAMTWETTTTDADQGNGKISANNGTISSATVLYLDDVDDAGASIATFVQSWDDASNSVARGFVRIEKEGTPSTFAFFKVSGSVTDASGYSKVAVTHIASNGTFSDGDGVGVHFTQSGADGSGDMSDVSDDSSPSLGGNLDLNSNNITGTGNISITGTSNAKKSWESKSANFNAAAQTGYFVNTSGGAVTATLPGSPAAGDTISFIDVNATFDSNNLTIGRNGKPIAAATSDMTVATERAAFSLVFYDDTQGWLLTEK
jgi:hypothetical protein